MSFWEALESSWFSDEPMFKRRRYYVTFYNNRGQRRKWDFVDYDDVKKFKQSLRRKRYKLISVKRI